MAAVPLGIGIGGAFLEGRKRGAAEARPRPDAGPLWFWREAIVVGAITMGTMLVALRPGVLHPLSPSLAALAHDVHQRKLSDADADKLRRGYYEDLVDFSRLNDELYWLRYRMSPENFDRRLANLPRPGDIAYAYPPSSKKVFNGVQHTFNSHGMRDREYTVQRPPGTFRIALVGSSHQAGRGVNDDETCENIVEDQLNREFAP